MTHSSKNIIDQHNRVHDYLRISLTDKCNLRCVYCMPEEGIQLRENTAYMNKDEIVSIAKTFVKLGVKKIRLTGGEPLIRKDVGEIITELGKLPVDLAITSNGILIDNYIDTFIESGLRSVNISLDTLKKDRFTKIARRDQFEKVISNIDLLQKHNFHIKLNAVIVKGENDDELLDFIAYTKHRPVHFRFIEFMPFDGNNWDWSNGVSFKEIMDIASEKYGNNLVSLENKKNDTAKSFKIKDHQGTFAVISSVTNPFCDTCNRIRLTADGKIKNCLFSNTETDLLDSLRAGKDIEQLIFQSIWNKKSSRNGMNSFDEFSDKKEHSGNRSMVAIGG